MADDRPVPLDEYPVHQVPLSMKHVATGDRNAYDRCIVHVFDHAGRALLILGLGVYPNLGVIDAYATLRTGDTLHAVQDGRRFVQAGTAEGVIRAGGEEFRVTPQEWTGTRDRSWGVRPIPGEDGGPLAEGHPTEGFHWIWCPVRFEDRFLMVITQEDADGYRTLNDATLVRAGHRDRQLGWPRAEITYRSGTLPHVRIELARGHPHPPARPHPPG